MAMVNRPRDFRHHDVVRGLRAAKAAGIDSPSLRIRTPGGTEYYFGGGEVSAPAKKSKQLRAEFAEGGDTPMHGRGDRTITAHGDAAVTQKPGRTGHKSGRGKLTMGGSSHGMFGRQAADQAPPGRTGKAKAAASPKEASGGM